MTNWPYLPDSLPQKIVSLHEICYRFGTQIYEMPSVQKLENHKLGRRSNMEYCEIFIANIGGYGSIQQSTAACSVFLPDSFHACWDDRICDYYLTAWLFHDERVFVVFWKIARPFTKSDGMLYFSFRQWTSFCAASSTAVYIYIYSFYYFFFKTK